MQIKRTFVWRDDRPDDTDLTQSAEVDRLVTHDGCAFELRSWDIRYVSGGARVTEAIYDETPP